MDLVYELEVETLQTDERFASIIQELKVIEQELVNCTNIETVRQRMVQLRTEFKSLKNDMSMTQKIKNALTSKRSRLGINLPKVPISRRSYQVNPIKMGKMARAAQKHNKNFR